jgi:hypothetical protein
MTGEVKQTGASGGAETSTGTSPAYTRKMLTKLIVMTALRMP